MDIKLKTFATRKGLFVFAVIMNPKERKKSMTFNYDYCGTKLNYTYNVFKVKDYDAQELETSPRLFSKIILAWGRENAPVYPMHGFR